MLGIVIHLLTWHSANAWHTSGINSAEVMLFSEPGWALPNELLHYRKNCTVIGVLLSSAVRAGLLEGWVWEGAIPRVLGCELWGAGWAVTINKVMKWQRRLWTLRSSLIKGMEKRETIAPSGKQNLVDGDDVISLKQFQKQTVHCLKMSSLIEK